MGSGHGESRLPTGTVTLVLADVEGSTRLWESSAESARSAMVDLDLVVDELVAKFDGARPLEQGEGDSFVVGFARASDAISFAVHLQRQLAGGSLLVRLAVHTGEVDVRDGARFEGPTIIRTARMRDLGHGGQILVSTATSALIEDSLPEGCRLVDLGSHPLKSLDRPERIHQLDHPDLPDRFPPLRTSQRAASTLPVQLTSFVGRTAEVADVQRLVRDNRLVTLTGAGGVGKTRLAGESLATIEDDFPDGVWWCDLGPLADPTVVSAALRTVLRMREDGLRSDTEVLCMRLAESHALVVLDNCEHLVDATAELVDALLRRCPNLRVLTTTREPVGVEGEVSWRVPSLDAPARDVIPAFDALSAYDAVRLFVERAREVRPNFEVTEDNAPFITEICARLEGIPLAIELAAARVRVLSVAQIAGGLDDRFRLLGRGTRTALARQQTLLASVGWSYDLLTEPQRVALRRLAVFAGTFTLDAAEDVVAGDGIEGAEVLELVSQLVDRSLLHADETHEQTRYRMLETIRQFARDRLLDSDEARATSDRHLDHYARWARELFGRVGRGQAAFGDVVPIVKAAYDNIRAACEWAIAEGRHEAGVRLASSLEAFWDANTSAREASVWLETLLREAAELDQQTRLRGLIALSGACEYINDIPRSLVAAEEAVPLARELGDDHLLSRALLRLAAVAGFDDQARGVALMDECIEIARSIGATATVAQALFFKAEVLGFTGDEALATSIEGLEISKQVGDARLGPALLMLGWVHGNGGDVARGIEEMEAGRAILDRLGNQFFVQMGGAVVAGLIAAQGDLAEARRRAERSYAFGREIGRNEGAGFAAMVLAQIDTYEGRFDDAERNLSIAHDEVAVFTGGLVDGLLRQALVLRPVACIARGDFAGARTTLDQAMGGKATLAWVNGDLEYSWAISKVPTCCAAARVARRLGEVNEAELYLTEAISTIAETGPRILAPDVLEVTAMLRIDVGADVDAARLFGAAAAGRIAMGIKRPPDPISDVVAEIASLRERLGDDAFGAAWAAGESTSVDDAVAFALRGRGPRQRPQAGWDALTPTELKVVALVAEGLSNPQIAERLFISKRTVSTHLSHVFAKVGVASRAELAAEATKRAV